MIDLLVMTDGRGDCLEKTIESFRLLDDRGAPIVSRTIHDDSGSPAYQAWIADRFPEFRLVATVGRSGFGGAIRSAWDHLRTSRSAPYLFLWEDDFVLQEKIDLQDMVGVLAERGDVVQLVLKRQPWNEAERAAGGICQANPDDFLDEVVHLAHGDTAAITTHRRFFSTNPYLARRSLLRHDWPTGRESEGHFTIKLREDPYLSFAFWGWANDPPTVEHIGTERVGTGY